MKNQITAVIDTSVFISAILSKSESSSPVTLVRNCHKGFFTIVTSPKILEELTQKLIEKEYEEDVIANFIGHIRVNAIIVEGLYTTNRLDNIDPKDNMILATAYESKSDFIVTLDSKHILPLKHYHGTRIVDPSAFIKETLNAPMDSRKQMQTAIY